MNSGKFVLRIPPKLHQQLRLASSREKKSLNHYCSQLLQSATQPAAMDDVYQVAVQAITTELHRHDINAIGIWLFGSAARGTSTERSDIDLLIVLKAGSAIERKLYRVWDEKVASKLAALGWSHASPQFVVVPENLELAGGLWFEVGVEGIRLWEDGSSVSRFMYQIRAAMAQGEIERRFSHGHPYWIRKKANEE